MQIAFDLENVFAATQSSFLCSFLLAFFRQSCTIRIFSIIKGGRNCPAKETDWERTFFTAKHFRESVQERTTDTCACKWTNLFQQNPQWTQANAIDNIFQREKITFITQIEAVPGCSLKGARQRPKIWSAKGVSFSKIIIFVENYTQDSTKTTYERQKKNTTFANYSQRRK